MMELRVRQKGQLQRERDKASLREGPTTVTLRFIGWGYSRGVFHPCQCVPWINGQLDIRILTLRSANARRGLSIVCSQISTVRINIMIKWAKMGIHHRQNTYLKNRDYYRCLTLANWSFPGLSEANLRILEPEYVSHNLHSESHRRRRKGGSRHRGKYLLHSVKLAECTCDTRVVTSGAITTKSHTGVNATRVLCFDVISHHPFHPHR